MGTLAVVVIDVLPKNQSEVALAEDEQPVQGFVAERCHALPLSESQRPLRAGDQDDLGTLTAEHLVELVDELGISVVDSELDRALAFAELPGQISGLLCDPRAVGMGGAVGVEDAATRYLQEDVLTQSSLRWWVLRLMTWPWALARSAGSWSSLRHRTPFTVSRTFSPSERYTSSTSTA